MKYDKLQMSDLEKFHKIMPTSKIVSDYKAKIEELQPGEVGHFTLSKEDVKSGTVKMRLLRASKLLGVTIAVKRFGNEVIFYKEQEAEAKEKTKTGKDTKKKQ